MFLWSTNFLLIGALSGDTGTWPEPLHVAATVSEEAAAVLSISQKTKAGIETFLSQSDSYALLTQEQAQSRLGSPTGQLEKQCGANLNCWERARQRLGVDLLLRVEVTSSEREEEAIFHLYTDGGTSSTGPHPLPRGGGAPLEVLDALLLAPGTLQIALENGSTHLQINGQARLLSPSPTVKVSRLSPGNHKVIVEGLGLPQRIEVIRILPGQNIEIPLNSDPAVVRDRGYRWWGAWASGALLIGGGVAILSGSGRDGMGWR